MLEVTCLNPALEVTCLNSSGEIIDNFTQWDVNQSIRIEGLNLAKSPLFHFCNRESKEALVVKSEIQSGAIIVKVPNKILQDGIPMYVYMYVYDNANNDSPGRTLITIKIPVRARKKPSDYTYVENISTVTAANLELRISDELTALRKKYDETIETLIVNIADGSPKGIFENVNDLTERELGVYLNSTDGYIYYWNGETISDRICQYQAIVIPDKSVSYDMLNDELKEKINKAQSTADSKVSQTEYDADKAQNQQELKNINDTINSKVSQIEYNLDKTKNEKNIQNINEAISTIRDNIGSISNIKDIGYGAISNLVESINAIIDNTGTQLYYGEDGKLYLLNNAGDECGEGITVAATGGGISGIKIEILTGTALKDLGVEDDLADESNYIVIENDNNEVLTYAFLPATGGGGGGGSASSIVIAYDNGKSLYAFALGTTVNVGGSFTATDAAGEDIICNYIWRVDGETVMSGDAMTHDISSFDFTEYCKTTGTHKVVLTLSDGEGAIASKTWNVQIVDVRIETSFDDTILHKAGEDVSFTYTPYGTIDKTAHFILDGVELPSASLTSRVNGQRRTYTISGQPHGSHTFECYITADIDGTIIETEHLHKDIIWYDSSVNTPVIASIYKEECSGAISLKQYNQLAIMYTVYDPSTDTPFITMKDTYTVAITDELGNVSYEERTDTYDATIESGEVVGVWNYKTSYVGEHTLTLSCGESSITIVLDVTDLGYDIAPITDNLAFDFNPTGLSNVSQNRLWKYSLNNDIGISVSDNFDWTNGGYQTDSEGNQYFCIKAGTSINLTYNLFGSDPKELGSSFRMIFKTTNVRQANAEFLRCVTTEGTADAPYNIGLQMNVHEAYLHTNADSLYIPYSEDDIIEFDFSINPLESKEGTALVMSYEDGVALRPMEYDDNHRLYQRTPVPITIGSEYCDVHIYRIKAYTAALSDSDILKNFIADARNAETMIARYERNQIYADSENTVLTPESVAAACPDLKVIMIDAPYFTNNKKDFVKNTTIKCIHKNGDAVLDNWTFENCYHSGQGTTSNEYGASGRNIDIICCFDGVHQATGNIELDPDYVTKLTLGDGTVYRADDASGNKAKVTLTRTSIPNNWFNIKVNIASSDNVNNAYLQKRYNDYIPYESVAHKRDNRIKNDMEFVNCVVFIRENAPDISSHREFTDNEWHFYAIGNLGDSKKTDHSRANDPDDEKEFVIEISDNTLPNSTFATGVLDSNGKMVYPITKSQWKPGNDRYDSLYNNWDGSYEFRYDLCGDTKDGSSITTGEQAEALREINKQVWRDFYEWVITSSDSEFINQFDNWCIKNSMLYWYLFTHRYTMIDNRAKNSFWRWSRWYITSAQAAEMGTKAQYYTIDDEAAAINNGYRFDMLDYDNDTALGINNSGVLAMSYGKEDIDYQTDGDESSGYIFNAADSVLWCRIRDLFADDLQTLYNSNGVKDCWRAESLITEFDKYQSQFPEELWRLDIERKYYRTYYGKSIDGSIEKASTRFLKSMLNGRKKYQRRQWERDQEAYMGTKYLHSDITADQIMFRCNNPSGVVVAPHANIDIIPYTDMYLSVRFGNTDPVQQRAKAGHKYTIKTTIEAGNSTAILIYCASRIQELSDLSACYIDDNDFSKATRLQSLVIGSSVEGYQNPIPTFTSLNLGSSPLLEVLDVQNCPYLKGTINLSGYTSLREFYANGTAITGVSFADNGKLEMAYLPSTLQTLAIPNLPNISDFPIELLTSIETLRVNNTINNNFLDRLAYNIINNSLESLADVTLIGIDWSFAALPDINHEQILSMLEVLYNKTGNISLTGIAEVTRIRQSFLEKYREKWRNFVINATAGVISQVWVKFYNADRTPIRNKNGNVYAQFVDTNVFESEKEEEYTLHNPITTNDIDTPVQARTAQYSFTFSHWAILNDDDTVSDEVFDFNSRITTNINLIAVYIKELREYTINWYYDVPTFADDIVLCNSPDVIPHDLMSRKNSVCVKSGKYKYGTLASFSDKKRYYISQSKDIGTNTATEADGTTTYYTRIPDGFQESGIDYYIEIQSNSVWTGTFNHYKYVNSSFIKVEDVVYTLDDIDGNVFIGAKLPAIKYGKANTQYYIETFYSNASKKANYYDLYSFDDVSKTYSLVKRGIYYSEIGLSDYDGIDKTAITPIVNAAVPEEYQSKEYAIFKGWNKSTGKVVPDEFDSNGEPLDVINVCAIWDVVRTSISASTGKYQINKELKNLSPSELHAITASGQTADFFEDKDYFDMYFGNDLSFKNVDEVTLVEVGNPLAIDPDNDFENNGTTDSDGINLEIKDKFEPLSGIVKHPIIPLGKDGEMIRLFNEDAPSFTLAVDYQFTNRSDIGTAINDTSLLSCFDADGNKGMKLRYYSNYGNMLWGNVNHNASSTTNRIMLIVRHEKGNKNLILYRVSNDKVVAFELERNTDSYTDMPLVFGGDIKFENGEYQAIGNFGAGVINWCKIWYDDLGDINAREIASWAREKVRFEYYDNTQSTYTYFDNKGQRVNATFICNSALQYSHNMNFDNTNSGGWIGYQSGSTFVPCNIRTYLNNKLYAGTPIALRSLLKSTRVPSNTGISATTAPWTNGTYNGNSYFYIPSYIEMQNITSNPYNLEGRRINWMTSNARRLKFTNIIIPEGALASNGTAKYTAADEPIVAGGYGLYDEITNPNGVKEGDIWQNGNNTGYIFLLQDTLIKKGRTATTPVSVDGKVVGGWVSASYAWLRSPNTGGTNDFYGVHSSGVVGNSGATNSYAVVPCFSI